MALCLMAGLIGLLILAYAVGHSQGDSAAEKRIRAELTVTGPGYTPPPRLGAVRGTESGSPQGRAGRSTEPLDPGRVDPRVPGLNYLVLASCPPDEARRLQGFLAERQVEVMVGPRNNKGLCQVIALRGFTRQQYRDTDQKTRFMARMRALGRDWKSANKGKGEDLSSMYYVKYEPPE